MVAKRICGKAVAALVTQHTLQSFKNSGVSAPRLAIVLANNRPDSLLYVNRKLHALQALGFTGTVHYVSSTNEALPSEYKAFKTITCSFNNVAHTVERLVQTLDRDPSIDGIIVQRPIIEGQAPQCSLAKDVDGVHPHTMGLLASRYADLANALLPCTAMAAMALLEHHFCGTVINMLQNNITPFLSGKVVTVVGRSEIAGMPIALMALRAGATVNVCHARTANLIEHTKQTDILVTAAGAPGLITTAHVRPGAIVVDVGISRLPIQMDTKTCIAGDVDIECVKTVASAITPVPGGVGRVTVSMVAHNLLKAALLRRNYKT